jgi:hypothetical protein
LRIPLLNQEGWRGRAGVVSGARVTPYANVQTPGVDLRLTWGGFPPPNSKGRTRSTAPDMPPASRRQLFFSTGRPTLLRFGYRQAEVWRARGEKVPGEKVPGTKREKGFRRKSLWHLANP